MSFSWRNISAGIVGGLVGLTFASIMGETGENLLLKLLKQAIGE